MKNNQKTKKFDDYANGKYEGAYENPHIDFYSDMALQVIEHTRKQGIMLDIGTGPGSLEKKLAQYHPNITVMGIEPSDTVKDAEKLGQSNELGFVYAPLRGTMMDAPGRFMLKPESLDTIAFPRSIHEVALSMGSREMFWTGFKETLKYLKDDGAIMIGDPMYNPVLADPKKATIFDSVRKWTENQIGHSHAYNELFNPEVLDEKMHEFGFNQVYRNIHPNEGAKAHFGFDPNPMFVVTYRK